MIKSLADMPSWTVVGVLSRIARIVQHFAENRLDREATNDAIQVAEDAARRGLADSRAAECADAARRAYEDAAKDGDSRAAVAAFCAAQAAMAIQFSTDKTRLLEVAERAVKCVQGCGKPESDAILAADIEQCAKLAHGLTDDDAAPLAILDFVHYQAVHEAGHAVAACGLGILFDTVRIIYNVEVDLVNNPIDYPEQATDEELPKYLLGYAAGAAAEDVVFGVRREWGCAQDRQNHKRCGGTNFDGDAAEVRKYGWFTKTLLLKVASLLEEHRVLSDREVRQVLKGAEDG